MKVRLRFRAGLAGLLAGGFLFGAAWAQSPDPEKAAGDAVRALDLQTDLPHQGSIEPINLRLPQEVVWLLLACGAAFVLYAMRDFLVWRRRTGDEWGEAGLSGGAGGGRSDADALASADELARQGRFVDAMHTLLLQSLADIRRRLGVEFADSLTSREILRGARLPPQGRVSLREIVASVEWTYFGGYPAALADYNACRKSFEALRQALASNPA
ncbi:MAG: DUF4129 domain-containing protein [Xanthobacteraceae bacterium]|nr:DUF4129 domain-containing protein [Xanthobacteraceae bacterium]